MSFVAAFAIAVARSTVGFLRNSVMSPRSPDSTTSTSFTAAAASKSGMEPLTCAMATAVLRSAHKHGCSVATPGRGTLATAKFCASKNACFLAILEFSRFCGS